MIMVDLLDPAFWLAFGGIIALIVGIATIGYSIFKGFKERKRLLELQAEVEDMLSREDLQLLRHRDFNAFVRRVNEIRAAKGQAPVEPEFLTKIQYNLMYALDESDF